MKENKNFSRKRTKRGITNYDENRGRSLYLDGPEVYNNGMKIWFKEGLIHREDGPAIEYPDGLKAWYWEGENLSEKEYSLVQKKFFLKRKLEL